MTHLTNAVEGSVVHDVAAKFNLGEVGEMSEHRDEELRVHGGGAGEAEHGEAGAPLLEEAQRVVDGASLDLQPADLGLDQGVQMVDGAALPDITSSSSILFWTEAVTINQL